MPGRFIALDGPDGTGKSTQCHMLVDRLNGAGHPATLAVDPGGTPLGQKLRELLLHARQTQISPRAEALLFMASRAELMAEVVLPALDAGRVVVSDRFVTANVAYQGHAGGLDTGELWRLGTFSAYGRLPDLTIIFDLPETIARTRQKPEADRMESRGADYRERVRQGFLAEVAARPESHKLVSAEGTPETVAERVWAVVQPLLADRSC